MKLVKPNINWNFNLGQTLKTLQRTMSSHQHQICAGIGIGTMWLSLGAMYVASPKIHGILDEKREALKAAESKEEERAIRKDLVIGVAKEAALPIGAAVVSTTSVAMGAKSASDKLAMYSTAYTALENSFNSYRKKNAELKGEQADKRIVHELSKDKAESIDISQYDSEEGISSTGHGEVLCLDRWTGKVFRASSAWINKAFVTLSRECALNDEASIGDLYDILEIPGRRATLWNAFGFTAEKLDKHSGLIPVEFTSCLSADDKPMLVMEYEVEMLNPYDII